MFSGPRQATGAYSAVVGPFSRDRYAAVSGNGADTIAPDWFRIVDPALAAALKIGR
jgi:hypothetical protein